MCPALDCFLHTGQWGEQAALLADDPGGLIRLHRKDPALFSHELFSNYAPLRKDMRNFREDLAKEGQVC